MFLCGLAVLWLAGCDDPEPQDPAALIPDWRTYYNRGVGVEFKYPYTLKLGVETTEAGELVAQLLWVGRETPVFRLETEGATEVDRLADRSSSNVAVDGVLGTRSATELGGEPAQQVRVATGGRVFTFTGSGETFEKVLESVKFLE